MTFMVLEDVEFEGRGLRILTAKSVADAFQHYLRDISHLHRCSLWSIYANQPTRQ